MTEKIEKLWKSLDRRILVSQRELVLGVAVCTLAGVLAGILLSPRKTLTIGSNNGSNNSGNSAALPGAPDGSGEDKAEEA